LTSTWQNSILKSSSRLKPSSTLWNPRGWIKLRKKCSTRLNDHTNEDNCRQSDVNEDDSLNTIRTSTLHQQIKTLITKIRDLRNAQQAQVIAIEETNFQVL